MIFVRFFEGSFDRESIVHDTRMPVVPRVGDTFTLRWPDRKETRYEALAVDYLLDVSEEISPTNDLTGVRVQVRAI